jgi:MtN3 and saliva related transmembrane protein
MACNIPVSTVIGVVAGCLSAITFVPQVYKTWKTKSAKNVSIQMFIISIVATLLWITYGIRTDKPPIYIANIIGFILSVTQVSLKVKYDRADKK